MRPPIPVAVPRWFSSGIAASLLLLLGIGWIDDWPTRLSADAVTETGEQRSVALDDGSFVDLNTDSAIAVDYRPDRRVVRLLKGEALFRVAADADRPFTVEAGGGATTALGTRFIIRRDGDATRVVVTEHRVRVASPRDAEGQAVSLGVGQGVAYGPAGLAPVMAVDVQTASAWTRGTLSFVDRPLREVVGELARYHRGYIGIAGDALAGRRVSGVFRADDTLGAVETLQRSLGISSTRITDRLILLHP